jgi:ATP-binding cassette subfamily G (WHITE) protein 2 (SNQ2)
MKRESDMAGYPEKRLGVTWDGLTVKGKASATVLHDTVLSLFNIPDKIRRSKNKIADKVILDDSFGCVRPGQMLMVLARPGGGATTLLRLLSNKREGFTEISGEVKYGTMDHEQAREFRGEIVMNEEDVSSVFLVILKSLLLISGSSLLQEVFYPHMTVGQTVEFATALKTPAAAQADSTTRAQHKERMISFLLRSMSIEHTKSTRVGDEYVRGVSGGERKRLSIIETLATRGTIVCWDNSTRGKQLDEDDYWKSYLINLLSILQIRPGCIDRFGLGSSYQDYHRRTWPEFYSDALPGR